MITEQVEGSCLTGYVTRPAGSGPFPDVIVLHEIWGLNPAVKATADLLADEGYAWGKTLAFFGAHLRMTGGSPDRPSPI
jgi:dienelactone hydrolase